MLTDPDIELLRRRYEQQLPRFEEAALWVERRVRDVLRRHAVFAMTSSRAKSAASFERRVRRDAADERWGREAAGEPFDRLVTDVAGCRVIVYRAVDVDRAVIALKGELELALLPRSEQVHRKDSGYRATHLLVAVSDDASRASLRGTTVEVQAVTIAAHLFNELEHSAIYKQVQEECKQAATSAAAALREVVSEADRCSEALVKLAAEARTKAGLPVSNAVDLAVGLEQELGRPVHGEFEIVLEFTRSMGDPKGMEREIRMDDLLRLHRDGGALAPVHPGNDADDATAILLALRKHHPDEFKEFARRHRQESPMVMNLFDRLRDRGRTTP